MRRHLISSSSSALQLSHLLLPSSRYMSSYSSPRRDDDLRNVGVSVWWDFENCNLPSTVKPFKIAGTITAALRANGIKGPIQITAFGDMFQLSRANQEALSSTGISLTHVPSGGKNSADRSLLADLMYWVSQNPPPAHLFLISGDRDFASILHKLRMNNYNILLATLDNAPGVLCSAASIMWPWHDLLMGDNLTGRYFNQPPDGPYGSWYGHYKAPLEDPFSSTEQPEVTQAERLSEPGSDSKLQMIPTGSESKFSLIPKTVVKQIRHILKSHPKGISICELRWQLEKYNVNLEVPLYLYNKFSSFLASMPDILRIKQVGSGHFMIYGVTPKSAESFMRNPGDSDNGNKLDCEDTSTSDSMSRKLSFPTSPEKKLEEPCQELQQPTSLDSTSTSPVDGKLVTPPSPEKLSSIDEKTLCPHSPDHMKPLLAPVDEKGVEVAEAQETELDLPTVVGQDSESDVGYFKRIWRNWFGSRVDVSGSSCNNQERIHTSREGSKKEGHETLKKHCTNISRIPSKDEMQRSPGHGEEKCKNIPHTGVSPPLVKNHLSDESRNEILADCQKLANEKLKEFPNGYNIAGFRQQFLSRFGYYLDLKMLGYGKLANLLKSLDGVKVDSTFIVPFSKAPEVCDRETVPEIKKRMVSHPVFNSDNHFYDSRKEDNSASRWDELGPVTNASYEKNVVAVAPRKKKLESTGFDYEPSLSDYSDSDGEASAGTILEGQGKGRVNEAGSSLLGILDHWHENMGKSKTVDCRKPYASPVKRYNFVAEPFCDDKSKSIDDILRTKSKSSESRMES